MTHPSNNNIGDNKNSFAGIFEELPEGHGAGANDGK